MVANPVTAFFDADARVVPGSPTGLTEKPRRKRARETFVLAAANLSRATDVAATPNSLHRAFRPGVF
ncbi:hypothetical protein NDI76_19125 [Halogeometricum sp. S1BR25-6]|uniref:Transposase n=1 Tax=Halogeometricum salsisoli TaxID=2950536 RepID=A0ABU2GJ52_9EURY|nr:hypothetical protein [Halogeometricum sp. S1BR25-6]MDS0300866.1 hypothetical protein [Halogeometricum sp. S1BR25-6]